MKVTFFSNFLNHHQIPFCDEMVKHPGTEFTFVSTEEVPQERLDMGYRSHTGHPCNLTAYTNEANYSKALQLGIDSDIVITGSAPEVFVQERIRRNKHTFRYSERLLKRGDWRLLDPRVLFSFFSYHTRYRRKNLYMLCASAYTANDLSWVFAYPDKKYKWGYFPEVRELDIEQTIARKPSGRIEMIWVARFIDWKHPELAVRLAFELKKKGYDFHLNMIGAGGMVDSIHKLVYEMDVADRVSILGGIKNAEVIDHMQNSHVLLFTSDRNEGWGAVLNEAMSSGCAVVASHLIGAVPFLMKHQYNGLIFESGSLSDLLRQTEKLILDRTLRETLGRNAYRTMRDQWNPKKAAANFIRLAKSMLDGEEMTIESGPCSMAENTPKGYWQREKP